MSNTVSNDTLKIKVDTTRKDKNPVDRIMELRKEIAVGNERNPRESYLRYIKALNEI